MLLFGVKQRLLGPHSPQHCCHLELTPYGANETMRTLLTSIIVLARWHFSIFLKTRASALPGPRLVSGQVPGFTERDHWGGEAPQPPAPSPQAWGSALDCCGRSSPERGRGRVGLQPCMKTSGHLRMTCCLGSWVCCCNRESVQSTLRKSLKTVAQSLAKLGRSPPRGHCTCHPASGVGVALPAGCCKLSVH
uniref:Uncharacterized protein n=1 Tax=Rousettus aegyptiacus TaxID=9407 RepID=A0A7J8F0X7_ROUAE|nr:hypothetical protein HJG63_012451 [Rousettus aegyptiacus]